MLKRNINVPPIILSAGIPLQLEGIELSDYLSLDVLNVSGIDSNALRNNGSWLPEGFYRVSVLAKLHGPMGRIEKRCLPPVLFIPKIAFLTSSK